MSTSLPALPPSLPLSASSARPSWRSPPAPLPVQSPAYARVWWSPDTRPPILLRGRPVRVDAPPACAAIAAASGACGRACTAAGIDDIAIRGEKGGAIHVCRCCCGDARGDKEDGDDNGDDNDDDDDDHDDDDMCDGRRRRRERSARGGAIACMGGAAQVLVCVSLFFPPAVFFVLLSTFCGGSCSFFYGARQPVSGALSGVPARCSALPPPLFLFGVISGVGGGRLPLLFFSPRVGARRARRPSFVVAPMRVLASAAAPGLLTRGREKKSDAP